MTLLVVYGMFLHFQISSQSNGGPNRDLELSPIDSEDTLAETPRSQKLSGTRKRQSKHKPDEEPRISKLVAFVLLLSSAGVVSTCAEFMVDSIEHVIADAPITEAFLGLIILPLLGNVAELGTAVTVAVRQKIDLAINVTVGSAVQISLFMAPVVTLLGWAIGRRSVAILRLIPGRWPACYNVDCQHHVASAAGATISWAFFSSHAMWLSGMVSPTSHGNTNSCAGRERFSYQTRKAGRQFKFRARR